MDAKCDKECLKHLMLGAALPTAYCWLIVWSSALSSSSSWNRDPDGIDTDVHDDSAESHICDAMFPAGEANRFGLVRVVF
jgi:hypothetical protein